MKTSPDGSPVNLYLRLPYRTHEASLIHQQLTVPSTVLDLGCGTGRLADPLALRGHAVTAVDNEPEMLAALRMANGVCADITTLDLDRRFDAVLLMSHFVDVADDGFARAVLGTVRRHLHDSGIAIVERHPPGWVFTCKESTSEADGVRYIIGNVCRVGDVVSGTIRYEFDGLTAEQQFAVRDLNDARLAEVAATADLAFESTLNESRTLAVLRPLSPTRCKTRRR